MDGPGDYYIKGSKPERERQISYDITHLWNLIKNDTNDLIYKNRNRLTDIENKLMVTKGERWGEG